MDGTIVGAALLSAFLHAAWHAAVKASPDPQSAMAAVVVASGLASAPFLLFLPMPPMEAVPWIAGSSLFNLLAMLALVRGYAHGGGFGLVYPLARASSPLLVMLLGSVVLGEQVGIAGLTGVVVLSSGVALFAVGDWRRIPTALISALAAGAFSAAYAVCDAQAARLSPSTMGYGFLISVLSAVTYGCVYRLRGGISITSAFRSNVWVTSLGTAAAILSYLLILWVWTQAPVAVGAALRDTSVVFGTLIAALVLKEHVTRRQSLAVALVTIGACFLRFA